MGEIRGVLRKSRKFSRSSHSKESAITHDPRSFDTMDAGSQNETALFPNTWSTGDGCPAKYDSYNDGIGSYSSHYDFGDLVSGLASFVRASTIHEDI